MRYLPILKQTIRALHKDYGVSGLQLTRYVIGTKDYTTGTATGDIESITISAIALPKGLKVSFVPKSTFSIDRKSRRFLISDTACTPEWVKEGNYIKYLDETYNIKWSELVEYGYYYVEASSSGDEPDVT